MAAEMKTPEQVAKEILFACGYNYSYWPTSYVKPIEDAIRADRAALLTKLEALEKEWRDKQERIDRGAVFTSGTHKECADRLRALIKESR